MKQRRSVVREVLHRGLLPSEADVEAALTENRVRVNGAVVSNEASMVAPGDTVHVAPTLGLPLVGSPIACCNTVLRTWWLST